MQARGSRRSLRPGEGLVTIRPAWMDRTARGLVQRDTADAPGAVARSYKPTDQNNMKSLERLSRILPVAAVLLACWVAAHGQDPQTVPAGGDPSDQSPAGQARPEGLPAETPPEQGTPDIREVLPRDRVIWHIPDPERDKAMALEAIGRARREQDKASEAYVERVINRIEQIRRPEQLELTLEEAIIRALANNYAIQVASYNPAVETTRVVEAEAVFDAAFFGSVGRNNVDRPSGSQLVSTDLDIVNSAFGIRKLLPSGALVSASYGLNRSRTNLEFQEINPEYTSNFILEARQPLLRGFGIDFNRSLIVIAQNDRRVSEQTFARQVRETIRLVEELYWRLVQARRDIVITARVLGDFETIYEYLEARQAFDITPVQLAATKANLEQSRTDFILRRAAVFDAEDRLTAIMNSSEVDLADDVEIIPTSAPRLHPMLLNRLSEVQTALNRREEIREQEIRVESAKVLVGRQANQELPNLDLVFRTTYDGLGISADDSFDQLTQGNFITYFVGVEFEYPIGNRSARAGSQRSRLQFNQQKAELQRVMEDVILETNLAVRQVSTAYDAITPSFLSAEAREREVDSIVARAERRDFVVLNQELGARQSLADARRTLLAAMVAYNIALIDLERAKGTLLDYHNVVIPAVDVETVAPVGPHLQGP